MVIPEKILSLIVMLSMPTAIAVGNLSYDDVPVEQPVLEEIVVQKIIDPDELFCMSQNIYFEARNESDDGKRAVAHVTLNRVESAEFPDTVCEVVYQSHVNRSGNPIRNKCQFSWYCDGRSDSIRDWEKFHSIMDISRAVMRGEYEDNTSGATYYHANYVRPRWSRVFTRVAMIDTHIFYRPEQDI
jgi:spore germination cell wall hydrolase CwlJ-like protein